MTLRQTISRRLKRYAWRSTQVDKQNSSAFDKELSLRLSNSVRDWFESLGDRTSKHQNPTRSTSAQTESGGKWFAWM